MKVYGYERPYYQALDFAQGNWSRFSDSSFGHLILAAATAFGRWTWAAIRLTCQFAWWALKATVPVIIKAATITVIVGLGVLFMFLATVLGSSKGVKLGGGK